MPMKYSFQPARISEGIVMGTRVRGGEGARVRGGGGQGQGIDALAPSRPRTSAPALASLHKSKILLTHIQKNMAANLTRLAANSYLPPLTETSRDRSRICGIAIIEARKCLQIEGLRFMGVVPKLVCFAPISG